MNSRRRFLAGAGGTALVAAPITAQTHSIAADSVLTAACAAFCQAQADFDVINAQEGWDDAEVSAMADRWRAARNAVLASPPPTTPGGRVALTQAAQVALLIAVGDLGPGGWEANATPEYRMVQMALSATAGSAGA